MTTTVTMPHADAQAGQDAATTKLDALPRLSHRERSQAVGLDDAEPGQYLLVEDGDDRRLLPLTRDVTGIGRGFAVDLRLDDVSVSRRHAVVARRGGRVRILDDRSSNGTWVNGKRVQDAELSDGDVVVLGRVVLTFVDVSPSGRR
jgi:pSer/pThr/pTyr-binding forkhead associated (FHA) protein